MLWKDPTIMEGATLLSRAHYSKDDIWNLGETGHFWNALPDNWLGQGATQSRGVSVPLADMDNL